MADQSDRPILVVDDDRSFRAFVTTTVQDAGYEVVEAGSGEEALDEVRAAEPQAVVLDVHLPGLSGHEVCSQLRDLPGGGPPVLFVSGERTETFDRVGGLLVGGDDYLVKPFAPDELLARIRSLVRRAQQGDGRPRFTEREIEILRLLAEGITQDEIAERLEVSPQAVRDDLRNVVGKVTACTT